MSHKRDTILADLAVELGYVSREQIEDATATQRKASEELGLDQTLAQVLESRKLITLDQRQELESQLAVRTGEARLIGEYEAVAKIGQGGMGAVYEAVHRTTGEHVALKLLPPSTATPEMIARFKRESAVTAKLNHPNIVRFVELGHDDAKHVWFCAMELIEGQDLEDYLDEKGILSEASTIRITRQIATALQHAHEHGLVHRDVKPQNVMITPDGTAKLLDLGLARQAGTEGTKLTQSGIFVGSPYYASPEQATAEGDIDTRSDIYSLGAMVYHMVTGEPPFSGTTAQQLLYKHVNETLVWPGDIEDNLSDALCLVTAKMMAKDPADRYQTPDELVVDLDRVTDGAPVDVRKKILSVSTIGGPKAHRASGMRPASVPRRVGSQTRKTRPLVRKVDDQPQNRNLAPAAGGVAAAVVVLLLLVVGLSGGGKDPDLPGRHKERPKPGPAPAAPVPPDTPTAASPDETDAAARDQLAHIRDMIDPSLGTYAEVRVLLKHFPTSFPDTPQAEEAHRLLAELDAQYARRADEALASATVAATALASRGQFDAAAAQLKSLEARFRDGPWLTTTGAAGIAAAVQRIERQRERSRRAATAEPAAVPPTRAPDPATAVEPAADEMSEAFLAEFDHLMLTGEYAKARDMAETNMRAAPGTDLGTLARSAAAVAGLYPGRTAAMKRGAASLVGADVELKLALRTMKGRVAKMTDEAVFVETSFVINNQKRTRTVELKWQALHPDQVDALAKSGGWRPDPAARAVVAAYEAFAKNDHDAAARHLEGAPDHALHAHLSDRIERAKTEAAYARAMARVREAVAGTSWDEVAAAAAKALELKPGDREATAAAERARAELMRMPFKDDFSRYADGSDGAPAWSTRSGRVAEGAFVFAGDGRALLTSRRGTAMTVRATIIVKEKTSRALAMCGVGSWANARHYWEAGLAETLEGRRAVYLFVVLPTGGLRRMLAADWTPGIPYEVEIQINAAGASMTVSAPGQPVFAEMRTPQEVSDRADPPGTPMMSSAGWKATFDDFSVTITSTDE